MGCPWLSDTTVQPGLSAPALTDCASGVRVRRRLGLADLCGPQPSCSCRASHEAAGHVCTRRVGAGCVLECLRLSVLSMSHKRSVIVTFLSDFLSVHICLRREVRLLFLPVHRSMWPAWRQRPPCALSTPVHASGRPVTAFALVLEDQPQRLPVPAEIPAAQQGLEAQGVDRGGGPHADPAGAGDARGQPHPLPQK